MSKSDGGAQTPGGGLKEILRVRREKAAKLADAGWSSFPNGLTVEHRVEDVKNAEGEPPPEAGDSDPWFTLGGRLMAVRGMGKQSFLDLWDETGRLQLQARKDIVGEEVYKKVKLLDIGDIVVVRGPRFVTRRGELTLQVREVQLATKSLHPLPDKHAGLTDVDQRYRQRYLDLATSWEVRDVFKKRSQVISRVRKFLDDRGFMEVETPILQSLLGGASAQPFVTHHNALDMDLYCRIAPELNLKRLLVGGFPRVYELGRNFRNEGLSTRHNPEFTMLEFYQTFATYTDLMDLTEELLRTLAQEVVGSLHLPYGGWEDGTEPVILDFEAPFKRVSIRDGLLEKLPSLDLKDLNSVRNAAEASGLRVDEKWTLGKLQMELFEHLWESSLVQPTFVTDFPVEVSPLARKNAEDPTLTDRFELYICGREIGNAFSELNDPDDQRTRFEAQMTAKAGGDAEAMDYDEDYVQALEIGMPPAAGEGIGIDRLVMVLTNQPSIRDVILFPHMRPSGSGQA